MIEILPNWHPIFVHFPIALLSLAVVMHVVIAFLNPSALRDELTIIARWNLWLGALFGVIAALLGLWAYNTVTHDTPSHHAMTLHRNWAIATLLIFVPLALWSYRRRRSVMPARAVFIVLLLIGFGVLASTAWHGAEVVYRYGIGVKSLPKADEHRHAPGAAHSHDAEAEHNHDDHEHAGEHDAAHEHDTALPPPAPRPIE